MIANTLLVIVSAITYCSCNKDNYESNLISHWSNRKIIFPTNCSYTIYGKDTVQGYDQNNDVKILIYAGENDCISCKLNFKKWKKLKKEIQDSIKIDIPLLFHFGSSNVKGIRKTLIENNFDIPICIDENDSINKLNHFPNNPQYSVFLLDKNDKVILVGNPTSYNKIKHLYFEQMLYIKQFKSQKK